MAQFGQITANSLNLRSEPNTSSTVLDNFATGLTQFLSSTAKA